MRSRPSARRTTRWASQILSNRVGDMRDLPRAGRARDRSGEAYPGQGRPARQAPLRRTIVVQGWCPDSEVRQTLQHALMRTSESKGHQLAYDSSAPFEPEVRIGLAANSCELRVRGTVLRHHPRLLQ